MKCGDDAYEDWPTNHRELVRDAMRLSEASVRAVWDNDEDAIYDETPENLEER